jgi:ribosome-associated translation inhibitor RaiA
MEIIMNIQISTGKNIDGGEKFSTYVSGVVQQAMDCFNAQITHVGVHFSDQNSSKTGYLDKRCVMEYHIAGKNSTAVTYDAGTVDEALLGAVEKVRHSLEHTIGKMGKRF